MAILIAVPCLPLALNKAAAQEQAQYEWARLFGAPEGNSITEDVGFDSAGRAYVVGYRQLFPNSAISAGFLARLDAAGNTLWLRDIGSGVVPGYQVLFDSADNVIVAGQTSAGDDTVGLLAKFSPAGAQLWAKTFGGSGGELTRAAIDREGNIYATGFSAKFPVRKFFVGKFSPAGDLQWMDEFPINHAFAGGVALDASGHVVFTGSANSALPGQTHAGGYDVFVGRYTREGVRLELRQFGTAGEDYGMDMALDPARNIYIVGAFDNRHTIFKYSPDLHPVWQKTLPFEAEAVEIDSSGDIYTAGEIATFADGSWRVRVIVVKYDGEASSPRWIKEFGAAEPGKFSGVGGWIEGGGLALDPARNVYVAGWTHGTLPGASQAGGAFVVKIAQQFPANQPPVINGFTTAPPSPAVQSPVTFSVDATDPDGSITFAHWDFDGDGVFDRATTTLSTSFTYSATGTFHPVVKVVDNWGATASAVTTLTVTTNQPPTASPQTLRVPEDTSLPMVLAGSDPNGDALTFAVVSGTSHGTLTGAPPNLTYTPAPDFSGADSFTFIASDGSLTSAPATVSINVTPVNDPPVANPDARSTDEDTALTFPAAALLANDADAENDPLLVTAVSALPDTHGTVTLNGSPAGFGPAATFTTGRFSVSVATGDFNSDGKLDLVVANKDTFHVSLLLGTGAGSFQPAVNYSTGTMPYAVAAGDLNADGKLDLAAAGFPTGTLAILLGDGAGSFGPPTQFAVGSQPDSVAIGDLNGDGRPDLVAANNGSANLSVLLGAGGGSFGSATHHPVGNRPGSAVIGDFNGDGSPDLANINRDDDSISVLLNNGGGSFGPATFIPVGDFPLSVAVADFDSDGRLDLAVANFLSSDLSVLRGSGDGSFAAAVNYATGLGPQQATAADLNGDGRLDLVAACRSSNAACVLPGNGDATFGAFTHHSVAPGVGPAAVAAGDVNGDGKPDVVTANENSGNVSVLPNTTAAATITYTPLPNFNGPASFNYTVSDGRGGSAEGVVNVTVAPVNDAPVAVAQSVSTAEDAPASITLSGDDVDGDTLSFAVITPPAHGTLSGTPPLLTYTPGANFNGPDSFTFSAGDGLLSSTATVSITVTAANDSPTAVADSATTDEDTPVDINVLGNDTDADGDALTVTAVGSASNGVASVNGGSVRYTPAPDFNGVAQFTYTISDGHGGTATATVTVTVNAANDAPAANADAKLTDEDTPVSLPASDLTANDTDADGDALTVTAVAAGPDTHGTVVLSGGVISYTPAPNFNGAASFSYTVSDGHGGVGVGLVSVSVSPVNDAPTAHPFSVTTPEDTPAGLMLTGSDVDGDALTFAPATLPSNGTLSGTAPNLTYTPAANFSGADSFTFTASDGSLTSAAVTVNITVTPVNDPPTVSSLTASPSAGTAPLAVAFSVSASDVDGTVVSVRWDFNGDGLVEQTTTAPSTTHTYQTGGTFNAVATVVDDGGLTASSPVSVNVSDFNISMTPAAQGVNPGGSTTYTISVGSLVGFSNAVSLGVGLSPATNSIKANVSPSSLAPPGTAFLTVDTTAATPLGNYTLTVTGTSGTLVRTASVLLTVTNAPQAQDFTLQARPLSQSVVQSPALPALVSVEVSVISLNGFANPVNLNVNGLPAGAGASFSANPATPTAISQLTVSLPPNTPTGSYALTITGTSGALSHSASATLDVIPPPATGNTPVSGGPVAVAAGGGVTLTYSSVSSEGTSSVTTSSGGPPPPSGFKLSGDFYEISTTATYGGTITVCINYAESPNEQNNRLLHREGNNWVDVTLPGYPDTAANVVCGEVTSFSEFAVMEMQPLVAGGGQSSTVDRFLTPVSVTLHPSGEVRPVNDRVVVLPPGTTRLDVSYVFGAGAAPNSLSMEFNGAVVVPQGSVPNTAAGVVVRGLRPAGSRSTLQGVMNGSLSNAKDRDRLVFVFP